MQSTSIRIAIWMLTLALGAAPTTAIAAAGGGGGGGGGDGNYSRRSRSPEAIAEREYKRGLRKRDSAWKHETKAKKTSSEKKRNKETSKAANDWNDAAKHFKAAITKLPKYYQAHSSLGYALRKLGQYDASIASYDRALKIKPIYAEALEYRAEAYLGIGRLEDASRSYMRLLRIDREKADQLMVAMEAWIENSAGEAPEVTSAKPATVDWFRGWVDQRKQIEAKSGGPAAGSKSW